MHVSLIFIMTLIAGRILQILIKAYQMNQYVRDVPFLPWKLFNRLLTATLMRRDLFSVLEEVLGYRNGFIKFWTGTKLTVACDDPENIKLVLMSKNCVEKPYIYRLIDIAGNGLFSSKAHIWKSDRKQINAVFTLSILKTFIPVFNRHFAQLIKVLAKNADQPAFDMTNFIFCCNYDILCETNLRYDSRTQVGENIEAASFIARIWRNSEHRILTLWLHPEFTFRVSSLYTEHKKIVNYFADLTHRMLKNANSLRATDLSNNQHGKSNSRDEASSKSMLLIDKLIEMEQQGLIDRERTCDQINTFVAAGTDTSSLTMLSLLLMLAINQDVQERVYEEICTNVHDIDHLDYDTLTKLEYMERTIKETMRMFPLTLALMREADQNIQLTECVIPEGTLIVLSIFRMHRSKKIWGPTANEFDPERFLPTEMLGRHPFAYLPFSGGPRNCIGAKYAMISLKIMLCHMLKAYKLSTAIKMSDITMKFELILKIKNKCLVKLDRRQ